MGALLPADGAGTRAPRQGSGTLIPGRLPGRDPGRIGGGPRAGEEGPGKEPFRDGWRGGPSGPRRWAVPVAGAPRDSPADGPAAPVRLARDLPDSRDGAARSFDDTYGGHGDVGSGTPDVGPAPSLGGGAGFFRAVTNSAAGERGDDRATSRPATCRHRRSGAMGAMPRNGETRRGATRAGLDVPRSLPSSNRSKH